MLSNGLTGKLYEACEWIMKLAYVNILWVCFSLLGIIVLGFFPATAAMFAVVRKWVMKETDIAVFKTFWSVYKKEFVSSNVLGFIVFVIGYVLYIDLQYFPDSSSALSQFIYFPLLIVFFVYLLMLLYVFPIFVHYDIKVLQVIKNASLIVVMNPLSNIIMVAGSAVVYYVMTSLPGLIPFFGGSALSFVTMWCSYRAFAKVQGKQERYKKPNY